MDWAGLGNFSEVGDGNGYLPSAIVTPAVGKPIHWGRGKKEGGRE